MRLKALESCVGFRVQQFAVLSYNSDVTDEISLSLTRDKSFPPYSEDFAFESVKN